MPAHSLAIHKLWISLAPMTLLARILLSAREYIIKMFYAPVREGQTVYRVLLALVLADTMCCTCTSCSD